MKITLFLLSALALSAGIVVGGLHGTTLPKNPRRATVVTGGGYFPVLIRLKNGDLMAVLRGGAPHIGVKGRLDIITSKDNGKTWSAPHTVVDGPEDDRNPALGQLKNGDIILAYAIIHGYDETGLRPKARTRTERVVDGVYVVRSSDGGKTWSKPELSQATHALQKAGGAISPFGKIVQLPDGTVLMSVYYEFWDSRGNQDFVFRSHNGGKTWEEPTLVGEHSNETALLALPDGKLLAALRSEKGGHLSITSSMDNGRTWTAPVRITGDNEHPADLIRLSNGAILLSFGERNSPFGIQAIFSRGAGKTWEETTKVVLANDAASSDCGYPSSVQLPDGEIVTLYYQVDDPKNTPASAKAKVVIWSAPN